jgi:hypothetical protein
MKLWLWLLAMAIRKKAAQNMKAKEEHDQSSKEEHDQSSSTLSILPSVYRLIRSCRSQVYIFNDTM